jgi:hypothetical protein
MIDEAHNTEEACRESTCFMFTKFQLENSIQEMREMITRGYMLESDVKTAVEYFIILVCVSKYSN